MAQIYPVPCDLVNLKTAWTIDGFENNNFNDSKPLISPEVMHDIYQQNLNCFKLHLANDIADPEEYLSLTIEKLSPSELRVIACVVSILKNDQHENRQVIEYFTFPKDKMTIPKFIEKTSSIKSLLQGRSLTISCEIITIHQANSDINLPEISCYKEWDLAFAHYTISSASCQTRIPSQNLEIKEFQLELGNLRPFNELIQQRLADGQLCEIESKCEESKIIFNIIALQDITVNGSISIKIEDGQTNYKHIKLQRLLSGQNLTKSISLSQISANMKISILIDSVGLPIDDGSQVSIVQECNPSENLFPTDVVFFFPNGQKLYCHKSFLIWLPVFSKLLSENEQIQSTEFDATAFSDLLRFLYTRKFTLIETTRIVDFLILISKCGIFENVFPNILPNIPRVSHARVHQLLQVLGTIMNIEEFKTKSIDYMRTPNGQKSLKKLRFPFSLFNKPTDCCFKVKGEKSLHAHKEIIERHEQLKTWFESDKRFRYDFKLAPYASMTRFLTFCYATYFGIELSFGAWAEKLLFLANTFREWDLKKECVLYMFYFKPISTQNYSEMESLSNYSYEIKFKVNEFVRQITDSQENSYNFFKDYYSAMGLNIENGLATGRSFSLKEIVHNNVNDLCTNINHQTAARYLWLAALTECQALQTNCINYIRNNAKIVIDTYHYQMLVEKKSDLIKLLNLGPIETESFQAVDDEKPTIL